MSYSLLEGGAHCRAASSEQQERDQSVPILKPIKTTAAPPRVDKWHVPGVLISCVVFALLLQVVFQRDIAAVGRRLYLQLQGQASGPQPTLLEQHLMGCRTFKTQPLPYVNTSASLAVTEGYTPAQRATADAYTAALSACQDFACLQRVSRMPRATGQFRFPHFMIIGFPKCATTSLFCHLIQHPQVQYPLLKEPHTLMEKCSRPGMECPPEVQREFVVDILNMRDAAQSQFTRAAFDGTTHYAAEGPWLAARVAAAFPWLRVVISMRDPISQALAMHLHNLSHGRPDLCMDAHGGAIAPCIADDLQQGGRARYGPGVAAWLAAFPPDQVHLVQYERAIAPATMAPDLAAMKAFLGVDAGLPSTTLPLTNWKHMRGGPDALGRYWNMTRGEYEHLVGLARRNTQEVLHVMEQHGKGDRQTWADWLAKWELVWRTNLRDNCEEGPQGRCKVVVS